MPEEMPEVKSIEEIKPQDLINMDAVTEYGEVKIVYKITNAAIFLEGDINLTFELEGSKSHVLIHPHEITREDGGFVINHDGKIYKVRPAPLS